MPPVEYLNETWLGSWLLVLVTAANPVMFVELGGSKHAEGPELPIL